MNNVILDDGFGWAAKALLTDGLGFNQSSGGGGGGGPPPANTVLYMVDYTRSYGQRGPTPPQAT
jgi:hypothetical protein